MKNKADFAKWHVVGGGPGVPCVFPNESLIQFNGHACVDNGKTTWIFNGLHHKSRSGYHVEGMLPFPEFSQELEQAAECLHGKLRSKPSTALATVWAMKERIPDMRISSMNLLPSIVRHPGLPPTKPLACCFHNWLGERRMALPLLPVLDWRELLLPDDGVGESGLDDPFRTLALLPSIDRKKAAILIERLAGTAQDSWTGLAGADRLMSIEGLFYLDRNVRETKNWWLFDEHASAHMATIHKKLAVAQQKIFGLA